MRVSPILPVIVGFLSGVEAKTVVQIAAGLADESFVGAAPVGGVVAEPGHLGRPVEQSAEQEYQHDEQQANQEEADERVAHCSLLPVRAARVARAIAPRSCPSEQQSHWLFPGRTTVSHALQ